MILQDTHRLIQIGRETLRRKFFEADIGVSGVNFAIAETGTLLLVENGSRPQQRQLLTTLADAATAVQGMMLQSPCLILVGQVARRQRQVMQLVTQLKQQYAAEIAA